MVVGEFRTPDVVEVLQLVRDRYVHAVEARHFVWRAYQRSLSRRPIVPGNVDDQGVVKIAVGFDRVDHPADLGIGIGEIGGIDIGLTDEHLLLVIGQLVPVLQQVGGPWGQLGRFRG